MTNGNQSTPRTAGGSPASAPAAASQPTIQPADQTPATPPEEKPLGYAIKLYAVSPKGFVVEITTAAAERPVNWIGTMTDGLERLHYTPIDPYAPANIDVDVAAPVGAQASSSSSATGGEAVWIKGDGGAPPSCSLHGIGKWVAGVHKDKRRDGSPNPQAGQKYAFWSCTVQDCRPKGSAA